MGSAAANQRHTPVLYTYRRDSLRPSQCCQCKYRTRGSSPQARQNWRIKCGRTPHPLRGARIHSNKTTPSRRLPFLLASSNVFYRLNAILVESLRPRNPTSYGPSVRLDALFARQECAMFVVRNRYDRTTGPRSSTSPAAASMATGQWRCARTNRLRANVARKQLCRRAEGGRGGFVYVLCMLNGNVTLRWRLRSVGRLGFLK